jgi:hypothetical protein
MTGASATGPEIYTKDAFIVQLVDGKLAAIKLFRSQVFADDRAACATLTESFATCRARLGQ